MYNEKNYNFNSNRLPIGKIFMFETISMILSSSTAISYICFIFYCRVLMSALSSHLADELLFCSVLLA